MKCQNCGKDLNQEAKFCDGCGTPISYSQQFTAQPVSYPAQKRNYNQERMNVRIGEIAELNRMIGYFSKKSAQYTEYDNVCARIDHLARGKKSALLVWGIIVASLGVLSAFASFASREYGALFIFFLIYIFPGAAMICGHVFSVRAYNKNVATANRRYDELTNELFNYYKAYGYCPVGAEYTNPSNLVAILNVIQSGRADTTKDAINVLVEDTYRCNMQKIAAQTARSAAAAARGAKTSAVFSAANFFLR